MKQITHEWINSSKSDLELVKKVIADENLTHLAAFHCQQALEKGLKAILEEYSDEVPKIHNIATLLSRVSPYIKLDYDYTLVKTLDQLYIEARYPGGLGLLPDGKPSLQELRELFDFTVRITTDIIDKLNKKT